jgi:DnaK suppressor protein
MDEFYQRMGRLLNQRRNEILQALRAEDKEFQETISAGDLTDPGDIASNDLERLTLDAIGAQNSLALTKIDAALARIENGNYGVCANCGKMISKDRLEVIPEAVFCIDCQSKAERFR